MSRRRISQREARAAIARVAVLEEQARRQRSLWAKEWPGGVHVGTIEFVQVDLRCEAAFTARKLGHAVVAVPDHDRKRLMLFAMPLATEPQL